MSYLVELVLPRTNLAGGTTKAGCWAAQVGTFGRGFVRKWPGLLDNVVLGA